MLELREAPRPLGEVVDEERGPLRADDLRTGRDRAGRRFVHRVHGPHGHVRIVPRAANATRRRAQLNGTGQASIFGIENRAIVPKPGAGLQAWAIPASQATDRKMNASSIEKPHWSTSSRAASSEQSFSASSKAS